MTLGLYLIACHALGDFPLQTDRMAQEKFDSPSIRVYHCAVYTLAFLPLLLVIGWPMEQIILFSNLLFISHFIIDTRRWKEAIPIWYDQALHIIALAVILAIVNGMF